MPITYPYDPTAAASTNLVVNEVHATTNPTEAIFVPSAGPFYTQGLIVRNQTGAILTPGVQYYALHLNKDASLATGKNVCSVIYVKDAAVTGITMTYHCVGGAYSNTVSTLMALLASNPELPEQPVWGQIIGAPTQFAPAAHLHYGSQIFGLDALVSELEQIRSALIQGDVFTVAAIYQYIQQYVPSVIQSGTANAVAAEVTRATSVETTLQQQIDATELLMGKFGIGAMPNIANLKNGVDLNSVTTPGLYYCLNCTNSPLQNGLMYVHNGTASSTVFQLFLGLTTSGMAYRSWNATSPTAWMYIATAAQVTTLESRTLGTETDINSLQSVTQNLQAQIDGMGGGGAYVLTTTYNAQLLRQRANGIDAELAATNALNGVDLNNTKAVGEYWFNNNCANRPFNYGLLKVWRESATVVYQMAQGAGNAGLAYRYFDSAGGNWSPWVFTVGASDAATGVLFVGSTNTSIGNLNSAVSTLSAQITAIETGARVLSVISVFGSGSEGITWSATPGTVSSITNSGGTLYINTTGLGDIGTRGVAVSGLAYVVNLSSSLVIAIPFRTNGTSGPNFSISVRPVDGSSFAVLHVSTLTVTVYDIG